MVQFIFYNYNVSSECLGPKGCPRKELECDFWGRGQNWKLQITKKIFWNTYEIMQNENIRHMQL